MLLTPCHEVNCHWPMYRAGPENIEHWPKTVYVDDLYTLCVSQGIEGQDIFCLVQQAYIGIGTIQQPMFKIV
jgi:hypothetical protein